MDVEDAQRARGSAMESNNGKKLHNNFEQAAKAAKAMRTRHNEGFRPVNGDGGWVVGGTHVKNKTPYKRVNVKALAYIRALFDDIPDSIPEADKLAYANDIHAESTKSKVSEVNGDGENWRLVSWEVMSGRQLEMNNDTSYLVLAVKRNEQMLRIQMGGAFSRHIPLISAQAESLRGSCVVWHTWNSTREAEKWKSNRWFYMIEKA